MFSSRDDQMLFGDQLSFFDQTCEPVSPILTTIHSGAGKLPKPAHPST